MIQNECTREEILSVAEMKVQYDTAYPTYHPDPAKLQELRSLLSQVEISSPRQMTPLPGDIKIIIVLGTWCSDSRLHVSHFYNIADSAGIRESSISLICVDQTKRAENGSTDHLNIISVPTFIFMKDNKEIGRIIETPLNTLESDMVEILTKK